MQSKTPTQALSFWPTAEQTAQTVDGLRTAGRVISSLDLLDAAENAIREEGKPRERLSRRMSVKAAIAIVGAPRLFRFIDARLLVLQKDTKGWTFVDRQDVIDLLKRADLRSF